MSMTPRNGLVGDSITITVVLSVVALHIDSALVAAKAYAIRSLSNSSVANAWVPPYNSSIITTWSPEPANARMEVLMAAIPELKSTPSSAPSNAQTLFTTASRLGVLK
jgi:hypothetical protein